MVKYDNLNNLSCGNLHSSVESSISIVDIIVCNPSHIGNFILSYLHTIPRYSCCIHKLYVNPNVFLCSSD